MHIHMASGNSDVYGELTENGPQNAQKCEEQDGTTDADPCPGCGITIASSHAYFLTESSNARPWCLKCVADINIRHGSNVWLQCIVRKKPNDDSELVAVVIPKTSCRLLALGPDQTVDGYVLASITIIRDQIAQGHTVHIPVIYGTDEEKISSTDGDDGAGAHAVTVSVTPMGRRVTDAVNAVIETLIGSGVCVCTWSDFLCETDTAYTVPVAPAPEA